MKQLLIQQKFFAIHDRFAITDENGQLMFYAKNEIIRMWSNLSLFDPTGSKILYTLRAKFFWVFSKVRILAGSYESENDIGMFQEKFAFPFRKAIVKTDMPNVLIKCGPIHLKAYLADENFKADTKNSEPVISIAKKIMHINDTYVINYDETKIPASLAALVGLWYDMLEHAEEH